MLTYAGTVAPSFRWNKSEGPDALVQTTVLHALDDANRTTGMHSPLRSPSGSDERGNSEQAWLSGRSMLTAWAASLSSRVCPRLGVPGADDKMRASCRPRTHPRPLFFRTAPLPLP